MKKKIILVVVLLFVLHLHVLYSQKTSAYKIKSHINFLPMGTVSTTGTFYPLGFACANIITFRNPGIDIMALSTKGSLNNIRLLKEREVKLAIVQSDIFFYAINKMKKFTDEDHSDLRALLSLFPEVVQIVLPADAKINSIKDLKGKRVILGSKGSGNLSTALAVLSCFDIDETNITPGYLSYDGAISSMENREFDAFFLVAGLPTKVYRELEKRMKLKILTLDTTEVKTICDKYNYFSSASIPAGTYEKYKQPVNTVALKALLIANTDLSDENAFNIVKTIFDNISYLKKMHPRAEDISFEFFKDAIPDGFLHKGSEKYYDQIKRK